MTDFDFSKYLGPSKTWYEIYSHDVPIATTGCDCVRYYQTPISSTKYNDEFNCRKGSVSNNDITAFNSTLYLNSNASEAGKMKEAVIGNDKSDYWVLDVKLSQNGTDEYSYALVYACVDILWQFPDQFVYFFSKQPSMPDDIYDNWYQYLKNKNVNMADVIKITQDGCWT